MEDKILVSILDEDPEKGMRILESTYAEWLYYTVSQRLRSVADIRDCVSDTLHDFYMKRQHFDPERGSLKAYLTKIAEHKAIHKFHESLRQSPIAQEDFASHTDILARWEDREVLHEAVESLPEKYRTVVMMKHFYGYETREIAEILGINYETVKKQLQRAYKKMQTLLNGR